MDDVAGEACTSFSADSDICQQLLTRYVRSSAAQHRHLCATAAATRSIIQSSSLPLTPVSYFAATITSLSNSGELDSDALGALTSFLSIVLPLVDRGEIKEEKAGEAVRILVKIVDKNEGRLGTSGVKAVVKCVGVLLAEYCNLKEWDSVVLGFEWLLKYSLDKRPKVRKCAIDRLLTVFKSFKSSAVSKASKSIYTLFKDHISVAMEMTTMNTVDGSKNETVLHPKHQEVIHLVNLVKHVCPHFSPKILSRLLPQLLKILTPQFSVVTRHVFDVIDAIFATSGTDAIICIAEDILKSLVSYISLGEKNPVDSTMIAATLAKTALRKLHDGGITNCGYHFPTITESLAGLLLSECDVASQTSTLLKELIGLHIDRMNFLKIDCGDTEERSIENAEFRAIETACATFYNVLSASSQIPNGHFFSVVAFLFLKLGDKSSIFMKPILLKIADLMNANPGIASESEHLEDCIGSAVIAMGPEKLLGLLPISFNTKDFACSNIWLIPILKKYAVGSSLQFFMEHIVPLAESFEKGSRKVKKSVIGQDLQAYAHRCWELFPAFCRKPSDTCESFEALAKLIIPFIRKDSFMLKNIAIGLQELVNENKRALASDQEFVQLTEFQSTCNSSGIGIDSNARSLYPRKTARKNIKALALHAKELLQALTDVFFDVPLKEKEHPKGAIGCLGSICDASVTKNMFVASLEKYQLLDDGNASSPTNENESSEIKAKRCQVLELASCIVERCDDDLANLISSIIKRAFQSGDEAFHNEAYQALSKLVEKNSQFCSSQFDVVMDLLTGIKPASDTNLLKSRFSCFQALLIHALMRDIGDENTKGFLILNDIIVALKDPNEEGRKAAYDALNGISSMLRNSSDSSIDGPYHKLLAMMTGYLTGSSPHIKSGAVSALSVLVYNDPGICVTVPDIVPTVMELLHSKAVEVIKAVLGFVKVLVSCLKPNDLQRFLPEIMDGIIRWSSVSRHHFKAKVIVILEIMTRKCSVATVKALVPEKYKDFVQGVIANRHGKTSSKEAGTEDATQEPGLQPKRKHDESALSPTVGPGKGKRMRRENVGKFTDRAVHSAHNSFQKGEPKRPYGGGNTSKRDFSDKNRHNKDMRKNNNNRNTPKPGIASKSPKHRKVLRKDNRRSTAE